MEPLAVATRNDYIESIHYGYITIVDASGKILYSLGDPKTKIFFRSSAKPIQAIPLLHSGAAEAFGFSLQEIALVCASHSGQEYHQQAAADILGRLQLEPKHLHCGIMFPYNEEEHRKILRNAAEPTVLHSSCSGKHAGILALAKYRGYSIDRYEDFSHPVQQEILEAIAYFTNENPEEIPMGKDGCGIPIYLLSMEKIALSYAKLIQWSKDSQQLYHRACKTVVDAMTQFPEMVGGDKEFCTELMQTTGSKIIGKVGSEAVYCLGIQEGSLGVCVKIIDGNERAIYPVVIEILKFLGILSNAELSKLRQWHRPILKNNLNETIGEIIPVFDLHVPRENPYIMGKKISDIL
ncbi:L-asparaginase II [Anaerosolibacter carboniphilus]|uniref:L-asparaginase II n=1 Tax=Anaerosolibacter carboniphilus TaxID=1417629 RepID=A0A841KZA4_9FIRM|nr:asparaginase [Anaerosolibacter carboniphilus]MBB6217648.1 L-asparaginase II [Anaerosolibacter carboniphilus]